MTIIDSLVKLLKAYIHDVIRKYYIYLDKIMPKE